MRVQAEYVKRKCLENFICPSIIKREKKNNVTAVGNSASKNGTVPASRKRPLDSPEVPAEAKKRLKLCEE